MNSQTLIHEPVPACEPPQPRKKRGWPMVALAALATICVGVVIAFAATSADDDEPRAEVADRPALVLDLGTGDALASCMTVTVEVLADMSPAFAATATAVDGELVTLEVDRWYAGGNAPVVQLRARAGLEALIAGFDFRVGQSYLITAAQGAVNFCGYSGPATPELTTLFDQAFPA